MTLINWISIGVVFAILAIGIGLTIYFKKRMRNLDGFMGIISPESEDVREKYKNIDE